MRKPQKGELLGFFTSLVRILPSKSPKFDASCLLLCQFQPKPFEPVLQTLPKTLRIVAVLKAGYKVSNAKELPLCVLAEPGVNLSVHRAPIIQPSV
jgi:hypothetical protein